MDVSALLAKLEGVRGRNGSWSAKCPAHADRSPSLSVKELGDGRILMHCFGGCGTDAVLGALGLEMTDLFPEPLAQHMPIRRGDFTAMDALKALQFESSLIVICAADVAEGRNLSDTDVHRCAVAVGRITEALEFVHGRAD
jgi:hypothetical protein